MIEGGLVAHMNNTLTNPEQLPSELETIRKQGFAISTEELTEGTRSVAAPIRDYTGQIVSAVAVVGPIQRMTDDKINQIAKKVMEAGNEASKRLGYDERYFKHLRS